MDFYQISIGVLFCFIEAIYDCLKFVAGSSFEFSNEISIQSFESLEGLQQLAQDYCILYGFLSLSFIPFTVMGKRKAKMLDYMLRKIILGGLGGSRGPLGVLLGSSWGVLGASWGRLGGSQGLPEASWEPLGGVLGRSWDHLF